MRSHSCTFAISGVLGINSPGFVRVSSGSKIFFPIRHGPYIRLWPRMIPAITMSRRGKRLAGEGRGGSCISLFTPRFGLEGTLDRFRLEGTLVEPMNRDYLTAQSA